MADKKLKADCAQDCEKEAGQVWREDIPSVFGTFGLWMDWTGAHRASAVNTFSDRLDIEMFCQLGITWGLLRLVMCRLGGGPQLCSGGEGAFRIL